MVATSSFYRHICETLDQIFPTWIYEGSSQSRQSYREPMKIVCLGIGSIIQSQNSRHQFSLLLLLRKRLNVQIVELYDPIFQEADLKVIQQHGFTVLEENKKGSYAVTCKTLFFMPHCTLGLYCNLLRANWSRSHLNQILIFGNSFSTYQQKRIRKESGKVLFTILPFTKEFSISQSTLHVTDDLYLSFCDTSIHMFDDSELNKLGHEFWCNIPPEMEDSEIL
eukprot:TRINITY_DN9250_c0_g1_i13.p1 TRINITY_DN9250_c0_g1~~TRINITY_DN9250_c0_g1_i13.p1  ORF type:complete len:223 (+),score=30.53 TRINITY_DN9250_c0_g1_i13:306-974(+)